MEAEKIMKISGVVISAIGMGVQVANSILEDKKMDIKIAKQISKQLKSR